MDTPHGARRSPGLPASAAALDAAARKVMTGFPGGRMVWRVWGEGPAIVLLHGAHGSWTHWLRQIEPLSRRHMVLVPDMPGHGASDNIMNGDLPLFVDALEAGLREFGDLGPLVLAGFSFGNVPAAVLTGRLGPAVRHFVGIAGSAFGGSSEIRHRLRRWQDLNHDPAAALEAHRNNLRVIMFHRPELATDEVAALQAANAGANRYYARRVGGSVNVADHLGPAPASLTFAWGAHDNFFGQHLYERRAAIARALPRARFHILPDTGHWAPYESPQAVLQLLLDATTPEGTQS